MSTYSVSKPNVKKKENIENENLPVRGGLNICFGQLLYLVNLIKKTGLFIRKSIPYVI